MKISALMRGLDATGKVVLNAKKKLMDIPSFTYMKTGRPTPLAS